jgi:outer membrane lipopolysaccharide assembly protein LptE/RlpB
VRRLFLATLFLLSGCGYTLRTGHEFSYHTIYIPVFQSKIDISQDSPSRQIYYPGLEVELQKVLKERIRYEGTLVTVSDSPEADLILDGEIIDFDRQALRYSRDEDIEEYRISVKVRLRLYEGEKLLWEDTLVGEDSYLLSGSYTKTEAQAVEDALKDLAIKIVDRIVENW